MLLAIVILPAILSVVSTGYLPAQYAAAPAFSIPEYVSYAVPPPPLVKAPAYHVAKSFPFAYAAAAPVIKASPYAYAPAPAAYAVAPPPPPAAYAVAPPPPPAYAPAPAAAVAAYPAYGAYLR